MNIEIKDRKVSKAAEVSAADMELVNMYTRRNFSEDEVYVFSVVLCDNEIDRDFERFSIAAVERLKELFIGKTCIFDHDRKSSNQTARIFETAVETEDRKTQAGEQYTKLTARAYIPKTEKNSDVIAAIESGILKEVSISCAVSQSICSICGKGQCSHIKGRKYNGETCCHILDEPTDAYECSFVAVPAQKGAGVTKSYKSKKELNVEEILKSIDLCEELALEKADMKSLKDYISDLKEKAKWGEAFRDSMCSNIIKFSTIIQPEMPENVIRSAIKALNISELSTMERTYEKMAEKTLPVVSQLSKPKIRKDINENKEFKI